MYVFKENCIFRKIVIPYIKCNSALLFYKFDDRYTSFRNNLKILKCLRRRKQYKL